MAAEHTSEAVSMSSILAIVRLEKQRSTFIAEAQKRGAV
jgi:hypothetical protein